MKLSSQPFTLPYSLISTLLILLVCTWFVRRYMGLADNIWRLFLAQPLAMCATPALVLAAGILSISIAPDPELQPCQPP